MATHDYVIDNGTGAAVRADLNNALAAIVSNNSSASEPSTKYAYQWWADTNTGILKIRNSANNGWVELLQLDGTLTMEDGAVGTPGLAFRDDLDTGIFSPADNVLSVSCGGVEKAQFNNSNGDMQLFAANDFFLKVNGSEDGIQVIGDGAVNLYHNNVKKVETTSNGIFATGRLDCGTTTDVQVLTRYSDDAFGAFQFIQKSRGSLFGNGIVQSGDFLGGLVFQANTGSIFQTAASLEAIIDTTPGASNDMPTRVVIATVPDGSGTNTERFRINNAGLVYIGGTNTGNVNFDDLNIATTATQHTGMTLFSASNGSGTLAYGDGDGSFEGFVQYSHSASTMAFGTVATTRLSIDASGNIGAPSGSNIFNASDERLKKNIQTLEKGLSAVNSLRPVSFNWIDGFCETEKGTLYGFVAQEAEIVDSNLIQPFNAEGTSIKIGDVDNPDQEIENALTVNEKFIIPMLVKAIQELSAKVDALESA
jgi:hypothetical protein